MGLNSGRLHDATGSVEASTNTNITGVIAGDGTNIRAATAADGDALPVTGGTLGAQLSAIDEDLTAKAPWVSVRTFGAIGDGVTNDYTAIQAAATHAAANGLPLYFPPGTYLTNARVEINTNKAFVFGHGAASKIIFTGTTGSCLYINMKNTTGGLAVVQDLWMVGTGVRNAVYIEGDNSATDSAICKGLKIEEFAQGVYYVGLQGKRDNPSVIGCQFYKVSYGVRLDTTHDATIVGNQFGDCDYGLMAENGSVNCCITGNNFDGSSAYSGTGAAIYLKSAARSNITGNLIEDYVLGHGILLDSASNDVVISGNYMFVGQDPKGGVICSGAVDNLTISGNHFNGIGVCGWAVDVPGGKNINISGNSFVPAASHYATTNMYGIKISNANNVTLCNNTFDKVRTGAIILDTVVGATVLGNTINEPCIDLSCPAIKLNNTTYATITNNVAQIATAATLTAIVEETGTSNYNIISSNRSNNAVINSIVLGANTKRDGFRGVLLVKSADQTLGNGALVNVVWASATYDTDGFFNVSESAEYIKIPAGVSKVRLSANFRYASHATGVRFCLITKNNAAYAGYGSAVAPTASGVSTSFGTRTAVLNVEANDVFRAQAYQTSGGDLALTAHEATWFALEVVE